MLDKKSCENVFSNLRLEEIDKINIKAIVNTLINTSVQFSSYDVTQFFRKYCACNVLHARVRQEVSDYFKVFASTHSYTRDLFDNKFFVYSPSSKDISEYDIDWVKKLFDVIDDFYNEGLDAYNQGQDALLDQDPIDDLEEDEEVCDEVVVAEAKGEKGKKEESGFFVPAKILMCYRSVTPSEGRLHIPKKMLNAIGVARGDIVDVYLFDGYDKSIIIVPSSSDCKLAVCRKICSLCVGDDGKLRLSKRVLENIVARWPRDSSGLANYCIRINDNGSISVS